MRPKESFTDRFFIQYHNIKCQRQVIGRNKIGETPGHCFRKTRATLLPNSGAKINMLKQLGRWKSTNIAQGYFFIYLIRL